MNDRHLMTIFGEALDCTSAEDRRAHLDRACGDNLALRAQVESLLRAHEEAGDFLRGADSSANAVATADEPLRERPGTIIGPYKLLEQIGEGGFGVVFMAEQTEPIRRKIALKILKPGMDTRQVVARFEAERQALAIMDHPNIAKVHDGGATPTGRPYFVMELVKGVPITEFCDQNQLTPRQRLELFMSVCQAVQHAHQKGIIHRDLKPSNILVVLHDTTPVPKVIDFGIAKALGQELTDKTLFTGFAQMIGTPLYMSPEQAGQSGLDIDTRSDIYSLGVLLYELLTGTTPFPKERFQQADYDEIRRIIREEEPPRPSTRLLESKDTLPSISAQRHTEPAKLTKLVRGELDWIVMKALEKDRNRRYETANGFAADVRRYLNDEPVQACPPSGWYRFRKFARRNQRALVTAALLGVMLLVTGGVVLWQAQERLLRQAEAERKDAVTEHALGQSLGQAAKIRADLHAVLKRPGGVEGLLNQPARWEVYLKTAQAELERAKVFADGTEGRLAPELSQRLEQLKQELRADEADYHLALRLEKIHLDIFTSVSRKFFDTTHVRAYPLPFASVGLAVEPGQESEVAARISRSPIKAQLLASLDHWAWAAEEYLKQPELALRLLAVARLVDPDPWCNQIRDPATRKSFPAIVQLADAALEDPAIMARLTPPMLTAIGARLSRQPLKALAWLQRAHALHQADFWINHQLGMLHLVLERYRLVAPRKGSAAAIGFFRAAAALRPDNSDVYIYLGRALQENKDLSAAEDACRKALAIDRQNGLAWHYLGNVLSDQYRLPAAVDAFNEALKFDPQDADTWINLSVALRRSKDFPAAVEACKKALAIDKILDKDRAAAWTNLGAALHASEYLAGAIDAFDKALLIDPQHADAWYNLGVTVHRIKDLPGAIDAYNKALAIKAHEAEAWNALGVALQDSKDMLAAIDAFKRAVGIDPEYAEAWTNLGAALYWSKDVRGAIDAHKRALAINPKFAGAWYNLGFPLEANNDLAGAIEAYEEAIRHNENYAEAYGKLGSVLRGLGDFAQALEAMKKAHELGSPRPDWDYPSAAWIKSVEKLVALDQRLPSVLGGEAASPTEQLALADMCLRYKKHYADAALLYGRAFAAEPKWAEYLGLAHRYNAARAAFLAAGGKGKGTDQLDIPDQARLRGQARDWLQADLTARAELLAAKPAIAHVIQKSLQQWLDNPELSDVRDVRKLGALPREKRDAWLKLWSDVLSLIEQPEAARVGPAQDVGGGLKLHGKLDGKTTALVYEVKLSAGKAYVIDMVSPDPKALDPYLVLKDADRQYLAEDDDGGGGLNARIIYRAPRDGVYCIYATSYNAGRGEFTLMVREKK